MPEKALATSPRIRELKQRLEKDPASRAFLDLAKAYQAAGDLKSSTRVCRQGLEKHPRYHSARVLLGKLLLETKELGGAISELGRVVGEAPENLLARRLLAEAQSEDGRRDQALETYKSLLRLQPADEETLTRISALEGATDEGPALSANPVVEAAADPVAEAVEEAAAEAATPSRGVETLDMRPDPGDPEEMAPPRTESRPIERPSPALKAARGTRPAPEMIPPTAVLGAPLAGTNSPLEQPTRSMEVAPTAAFYPPSAELPGSADRPTQILDLADMERSAPPSNEEARTVMLAAPDLKPPEAATPATEHLASEALPTPTLADLYLEQGLPAEAEKVYLKLLEGDPGNQEIHERLARLRAGESATPGGSARIRIRALEGWLTRIRRGSDAAGRA